LLKYAYSRYDLRRQIDAFMYTIPGFGAVLKKTTLAKFSYVLGMLLSNGMSILQSLEIARDVIANHHMNESMTEVIKKVSQGTSLSVSLKQQNDFPQNMVDMIQVGEETGRLEQVLMKVSKIYDK